MLYFLYEKTSYLTLIITRHMLVVCLLFTCRSILASLIYNFVFNIHAFGRFWRCLSALLVLCPQGVFSWQPSVVEGDPSFRAPLVQFCWSLCVSAHHLVHLAGRILPGIFSAARRHDLPKDGALVRCWSLGMMHGMTSGILWCRYLHLAQTQKGKW